MSKRRRRQRKTISTPLFLLMAAGALLVAAGIVLGVLQLDAGSEGGTPDLVVDQELIDYGDVPLDTTLAFTLTVTNVGDGVLRFREEPYIQILEGC